MAVYLKSVVIILFMALVDVSESVFCQPEEKFTICGNNDCRPTCTHPKGPKHCNPKCRPGCICKDGLVRRETDNHCVKVSRCPKTTEHPTRWPQQTEPYTYLPSGKKKCRPGEVYDDCHKDPLCMPTCRHPKGGPKRGNGGPRGCHPKCFPGCECRKGLLRREKDNKCVPPNQCPCKKRPKWMTIEKKNEKQKCAPGEEYARCEGDPYCHPTCRYPKGAPGLRKDGACRLACFPGCVCKKGLLRREKDYKCVPPSECQVEVQCDKGEVYEACHIDPRCLPSCKHPKGKQGPCHERCHAGCICMKNLVRRESDKKCVDPDDCKGKKCPPKLISRWSGRKC